MSKNRGKQFATRAEWLAVRNSRSMGQTLRAREKYVHQHKNVNGVITYPITYRKPKEASNNANR